MKKLELNLSKLNSLGAIASALQKFGYGTRLRPQRDWLVMISVAGILLLGSAGWSYSLFHNVSQLDANGEKASGSINTSALEKVNRIFNQRAAERAHYQNDYRFVDPSQ